MRPLCMHGDPIQALIVLLVAARHRVGTGLRILLDRNLLMPLSAIQVGLSRCECPRHRHHCRLCEIAYVQSPRIELVRQPHSELNSARLEAETLAPDCEAEQATIWQESLVTFVKQPGTLAY